MMYKLSDHKQKILQTLQNYWQRGNSHPSMQEWRQEAIQNFGFYDGSQQWLSKDVDTVNSRGQIPMTINIIQGKIDSLSGAEIQSRLRSACRNDSGNPSLDQLAASLTHLLFTIQENERIPYKDSLTFRDSQICGIGWSQVYRENGMIYCEYVHPYNMIPDMDDLSPQFDSMKYVGRKRWMAPDVIQKIWPNVGKYVDFSSPDIIQYASSPEITDRSSTYTDMSGYPIYGQSRVLVCEIQYKVACKAFSGIDYQGFYFETFDEEKAEDLANSSKDITEIDATKNMRGLYIDDFLLEHGPLTPNLPNVKDFGYIPTVWKRRFRTGVPYGQVDAMQDIQRDYNVRATKSIYLSNSTRLIISGNLMEGDTPEDLSKKLKTSDAVIVLPENTKYELKDNTPLSDAQIKIYNQYDVMMQRVTGIFDDFQGKETNASSGVAQRQRQLSSIRNNVFAFDSFADMKIRKAKFILGMIQGGDYENLFVQALSDEERSVVILNLTRKVKGKKYIFNDVRTLPISLYIEEVPDFASSLEEDDAVLTEIMSNPNAPLLLSSPALLKRKRVRKPDELAADVQEAMANQAAMQQASKQAPQPQQQVQEPNMIYPNA